MWPFRKKPPPPAAHVLPDRIWMVGESRRTGVLTEAGEGFTAGLRVLIVCHFPAEAAAIQSLFVQAAPPLVTRPFSATDVPGVFSSGVPIVLVLASALQPPPSVVARSSSAPPPTLLIIVPQRHALPARDDAIVAFASAVAPPARVRFHLALDEPPWTVLSGSTTMSLLAKLGMKSGDYLEHPMMEKSIRRAQTKLAESITTDLEAPSIDEWCRRNAMK